MSKLPAALMPLAGAASLLVSLGGLPTARAQLVRQANTTLNLPASLPAATGYTTENALGALNFTTPIAVRTQPGRNDRLFVVERTGSIQLVDVSGSVPTKSTFFSLSTFLQGRGEPLTNDGECGFLSMEFHPNYASNGLFYVFYTIKVSNVYHQRIARFKVPGGNPNAATSFAQADATASHRPLVTQVDAASNHNGGDLHFGPDGYLYASVGDEGGANDQFNNARFINKDFFGAILRFDVDEDGSGNVVGHPGSVAPNSHPAVNPGAYRIPADNPFLGATSHHDQTFAANTVRTEIYATGMRNPFRFSFDRLSGRLFVGDVGQDAWEEVDIITKGADGGWSWREGTHAFTSGPAPSTPPANANFTPLPPIYDYGHGSGSFQGNCVTGGIVYRGSRLTDLYGKYVFGDYVSGHLWALRGNGATWAVESVCDDNNVVAFGEDPRNGDVLLCDIADGTVKRLVPSGTSGTNPPALLSGTGAFADLATLTPNAGVVPYDPNVSFWSDYAQKSRWFSVPNVADRITFRTDGEWQFPAGTVWVKHFDLPLDRNAPSGARQRVETRFLVKNVAGSYGITYRWRADGSDADLVPEEGATATITLTNPATQTWGYPSRSDCRTCHTPVAGHALSFNTRQLNRPHPYGNQTPNQLQALSDAGYFTAPVAGVNNLPAFAKATDATQSLEWRVRSYLAVNCVQCHQPGGSALGTWDARPTTPTDAANLIRGMLNDSGGDAANRFAVPGDPAHSMVLKRVRGDAGVQRMPPLATNARNLEAETLLTAWINDALPARRSFPEWQAAYFPTPDDPRAAADADPDGDGYTNLQEFLTNTDPTSSASRPAGLAALSPAAGGNGGVQFQFTQPANRAAVVETSSDLRTWTLWDVPGNAPDYAATATLRTVTAPRDDPSRFFRLRLSAP